MPGLRLVDNREDEETLADELKRALAAADALFCQSAYLRESGLELIWPELVALLARGGTVRVLTCGDFAQTEPEALQRLREASGDCEVRLVSSSGVRGFHPKSYLLYAWERATLIVGSSNLTSGGLDKNIELNVGADLPGRHSTIQGARRIFDSLWEATPPLTDDLLADYRRFWEACHAEADRFIYRLPSHEEGAKVSELPAAKPDVQIGDTVLVNGQMGQVVSVRDVGERVSVGVAIEGVGLRNVLCPPTVLEGVETPLARVKALDFDSARQFDLLTDATRLSLAYAHDRMVSLSNSRTRLEPYQVEAVHKVISAWEQRFLIADDVGLGKTVEAGMIMKELTARHRADRVLVVAPAGLVPQWQREMREKFDERFEELDSARLREWRSNRPAGEPLSVRFPRAVVSLDLAKLEGNDRDFADARWDLVIFDEAHKVARHGESIPLRHRLADDVAASADSLLLLSATPHDGDPFAFYSLIGLLDPFLFADEGAIEPDALGPIMIRRSKTDILKEDGSPLFPPRWVETTEVRFEPEELQLYNEVTDYVREGYNAATELRDTVVGFLMVLLQKRMVSSIAAIRRSLERRLIALEHPEAEVLSHAELRELQEREDDEESLSDARREELQHKLESARLKLKEPPHQAEIARVSELVERARAITADSKARELRQFVQGVLAQAPNEKILVFTEYRDTLDYLRDQVLADFGPLAQIHGSMNVPDRQKQEAYFQEPNVRIMVATDAAGEGLNLQFCHIMVNYELPWNPNRIEQRIGRLHRYGQQHDVRVYNLQVVNTREGQILARLMEKIRTIEEQLGGYAPNVLGVSSPSETVNLNRLSDLIMAAIAEDTPVEVTCDHVEQALEARRQMCERVEQSLFMPLHHFDLGAAQDLISRSDELTPSNADIESLVRRHFEEYEGRIENTRQKKVVRLRVPRCIVDGRIVLDAYRRATFDKETAYEHTAREVHFIAFGHPLLDAVVRHCRDSSQGLRGATTVKVLPADAEEACPGILCHYAIRCADAQDNTVSEELLPVFAGVDESVIVDKGRELATAAAEYAGNTQEDEQVAEVVALIDSLEDVARGAAAEFATKGFERVRVERERQADASADSLDRFQHAREEKLRQSILAFQQRMLGGEDMDIAIRRVESDLARLESECERRRTQIESKRHVRLDEPKLLNVAVVARA